MLVLQLLLAFTITAFGVDDRDPDQADAVVHGLTQMVMTPLMFISGALFPVAALPVWLTVLNRIDPLTYAVAPMRTVVFDHLNMSPAARQALNPGVTWWGWRVPRCSRPRVVVVLGLAMLGVAIWEFSSTD